MIAHAQGAQTRQKRFLLFTAGNGWGHQGSDRHTEILNTTVRPDRSFDLPMGLAPLAATKAQVSVVRPLHVPFNNELHVNGWAFLTAMQYANGPPRARPSTAPSRRPSARVTRSTRSTSACIASAS